MPSYLSRLKSHRPGHGTKDSKRSRKDQNADSRARTAGSSDTVSTAPPLESLSVTPLPAIQSPIAASPLTFPPPPTIPLASATLVTEQAPSGRLWNKAYDNLKSSDESKKVVDAYEKILSHELQEHDSGSDPSDTKNSIEQVDTDKRRSQMEQLVRDRLEKTKKEDKIKETVGDGMRGVLSVKDVVSSAVGAVPQAALAWTGVCFALQLFENPMTESKLNRDGTVHLISRMEWYCHLSNLIFEENIKENPVEKRPIDHIQADLEERVVDLYQKILLYLMKSVCSCYGNRFANFLRDMIKLDDWDGNLKSVEDAENAFRQDSDVYNNQKIKSYLEKLVDTAKNQEKELLHDKKDTNCLRDLALTDPRVDKTRIERTKGGLLQDSYRWILENDDFQQWRKGPQSQLLWIKGDPGKGKTMLLCGIIDELKKPSPHTCAFFFCQATDSRINSATAVLRGLIYLLVDQQPSLISHVRKKYDHFGKRLFEDVNAWDVLSEIFTNILQDSSLKITYLIIDALDECVTDLSQLLDFVIEKLSVPSHIKWIVSSRNWPEVENRLEDAGHKVRLSLELNAESVSSAVGKYIQYKVSKLAKKMKYNDKTRSAIQDHLSSNANDTFLWVALVCQNLEEMEDWEALSAFKMFPPGLDSLYARMDETIKIWDRIGGKCLQTLEGHSNSVNSVVFSHDSKLLASASSDRTIKIWDAISSKCLRTLEGHSRLVNSIVFSHDGKYLASASNDRSIKIWDAISGKCLQTLEGHSGAVLSVVFSHDGRYLASASDDETIKIWDRIGGKCLQTLEGHSRLVNSVVFLYDSKFLASASDDKTIKIWDAISGKCLQTLEGHSGAVFSVVFSHDGRYLASASDDETIKIWDAISGKCLRTLEGHSNSVNSVVFSHDSKLLASASSDETIKIWDAISGKCLQTLDGHSHWVSSVAFSHDSKLLASASVDKTIKIWDAISGKCLQTLDGHSYWVSSVVFSHDSKLLASASSDKTIKIWDAIRGKCLRTLEGHSDYVHSVVFSHDSEYLVSASRDKTIKIWDRISGKCLQTFDVGRTYIENISFDTTGPYLHTDIGTLTLDVPSASIPAQSIADRRTPHQHGCGLSSDNAWITRNSENLVYLPSEYRSEVSAVAASTVAIGCRSGRVLIVNFPVDSDEVS